MKAAIAPAVNAKWEVRDIPRPTPGPNEVLLAIKASGLCFTDVHITHGAIPTQFPRTLGHEPVGEIVELGAGVTKRKVGDRVGVPWVQDSCGRCEWCLRGKKQFCQNSVGTGVQTQGSHAEFMVARADATVLIPDGVSDEQAAPIFCAGFTVWSGFRIAEPQPGDRVAIVGVGGLGHLALQYAKAAGHETIAVTHSKDKEKMLRDLGADHVVSDSAGMKKAGGADVILVTGNSWSAAGDAMNALRPRGRVVLMGVSRDPLPIPTSLLFVEGRILGSSQNDPEHLYEALDFVARGKVRVVTETFALDDIATAYDRVEKGEVRFRAVIKP
ncbi:MAG: alcohol dehydrogenase catalytic domain-containing protein [Acidobacteriota bacterium]